ncbi:MAG: hypothetical protein WKF81_03015 [Thermomicrobiales bacterium]
MQRPPYRQLHRDEAASDRLRTGTGYITHKIDGLAILRLYGADTLARLSMGSEHAAAAGADSALFIDLSTHHTTFASLVLSAGPLP